MRNLFIFRYVLYYHTGDLLNSFEVIDYTVHLYIKSFFCHFLWF